YGHHSRQAGSDDALQCRLEGQVCHARTEGRLGGADERRFRRLRGSGLKPPNAKRGGPARSRPFWCALRAGRETGLMAAGQARPPDSCTLPTTSIPAWSLATPPQQEALYHTWHLASTSPARS